MSGGRALSLRLAAREVRRRPGRTALVVGAVGLPLAGLLTALVVLRTATETPTQAQAAVYGQADAVAGVGLDSYDVYSATDVDAVLDVDAARTGLQSTLPDEARVVQVVTTSDGAVRADGHLDLVPVSDEDLDDPLLAGRYEVLAGRAPEGPGEAAVPPDIARRLGLGVGDGLDLISRGTVRVTGVVAAADRSDGGRAVIMGSELTPNPVPSGDTEARGTVRWFVDLPPGVDPATLPPPPVGTWWPPFAATHLASDLRTQVVVTYAIAGVVLLVTGMIAVAAFAVGARRQLRSFGILAAGGVPPAGLRRIAVLQGLVTGALASIAGVALALVVAVAVVEPRLDAWVDRAVGPLEVDPRDVVAVALLGMAVATVAAWVPARTVARVPVSAALAGRRPLGRVARAVPVTGLVLAALGIVTVASSRIVGTPLTRWASVSAVGGTAAVLLGGALMTPWIVALLEPAAGRMRGSLRLAARDLARHRVRTSAAAAAILAPAAVSVFALTVAAAEEHERTASLRTDQVVVSEGTGQGVLPVGDEARADVRAALPGAVEADVRVVARPSAVGDLPIDVWWGAGGSDGEPGYSSLAVATPELVRALGAPATAVDLVADDETIVAISPVADDIEVVEYSTTEASVSPDLVTFEDVRGVPAEAAAGLPRLLVSEGWARSRGLTVVDHGVVWRSPQPLTDRQRSELAPERTADERDALVRQTVLGEPAPPSRPWAWFERPTEENNRPETVAACATLVFALAVVAVTIALTRAEARDDVALLVAIGVPPATQRGVAGWQALLVPAIGVGLGAPLGLACAWSSLGVRDSWDGSSPVVVVPWLVVALLVAVPVLSGLVTRAVAMLAWRRPRSHQPRLGWD